MPDIIHISPQTMCDLPQWWAFPGTMRTSSLCLPRFFVGFILSLIWWPSLHVISILRGTRLNLPLAWKPLLYIRSFHAESNTHDAEDSKGRDNIWDFETRRRDLSVVFVNGILQQLKGTLFSCLYAHHISFHFCHVEHWMQAVLKERTRRREKREKEREREREGAENERKIENTS